VFNMIRFPDRSPSVFCNREKTWREISDLLFLASY